MIITFIETPEGGKTRVAYINLETRKKYILDEEGVELFLPLTELEAQTRIASELADVQERMDDEMQEFPVTEKNQIEIKRLYNKIQYLTSYEYNNTK